MCVFGSIQKQRFSSERTTLASRPLSKPWQLPSVHDTRFQTAMGPTERAALPVFAWRHWGINPEGRGVTFVGPLS